MLFLSKKCVLMSHSLSLNYVFRTTGPGSPKSCCEREVHPIAAAVSLVLWCPGWSQRHLSGAQDRCLPNAFLCVLVEALLTFVGENVLANLVQVDWLVEWSSSQAGKCQFSWYDWTYDGWSALAKYICVFQVKGEWAAWTASSCGVTICHLKMWSFVRRLM